MHLVMRKETLGLEIYTIDGVERRKRWTKNSLDSWERVFFEGPPMKSSSDAIDLSRGHVDDFFYYSLNSIYNLSSGLMGFPMM